MSKKPIFWKSKQQVLDALAKQGAYPDSITIGARGTSYHLYVGKEMYTVPKSRANIIDDAARTIKFWRNS